MTWLVTGSTGFLGAFVRDELARRGADFVTAGRADACDVALDLASDASITAALDAVRPTACIHVAALSSMAACAADPDRARRVNGDAVRAFAGRDLRFVYVSTDLVFDGRSPPYLPTAAPAPLSAYGASKLAGETSTHTLVNGLVVRLPLLFGRSFDGRRGASDMLRGDAALRLFTNEFRTPLHAADAARSLVDLTAGARRGVVHVAGPERVSRWDFAMRFAALHSIDSANWTPVVAVAPDRPRDVSLVSDVSVRALDAALADA